MIAKGRLDYIDVAKGIGMLLVVFCHINYYPYLLNIVYGFHMPLFFIIAGMMFRREKYPTLILFLKKRVQTLVIPYVILYLFVTLCMFFIRGAQNGFNEELLREYGNYLLQMVLCQGGSASMVSAPFWFVLSLFATEIIYYFVSGIKSKLWIAVICILLTGLGWFIQSDLISFPNEWLIWNLDSALFTIGFYAIGNLLADCIKDVVNRIRAHDKSWLVCICVWVGCVLVYVPFLLLNGKISIGSKILHNGIFLYLTGILGTGAVLAASILLEKCKSLAYIGRNSFVVMALHRMILNCYVLVCSALQIPMFDNKNILQSLLPFVFVMIITLCLTAFYNTIMNKNRIVK